MTAPLTAPLTEGSLAGLAHRHLHSGKVRELYAVGDDLLLVVATDRISAYDHVLPNAISDKGAVLTAMTVWWFAQLADLVQHHLVTADVRAYPPELAPYADALRGRSMLCRRLEMLPVECVARGYLAGSGLVEYDASGTVCGQPLPAGLVDGSRLPEPLFTPTTKAPVGEHDTAMTAADVAAAVGPDTARELATTTLAVYRRAVERAEPAGIIVADTKLEFGRDAAGVLTIGDEVLTPDSSRFWPVDGWSPGRAQPSYDKQVVRDWLRLSSGWDRTGPPPALPDEVVERTRTAYVEVYERLTGRRFADWVRGG